MMQRLANIPEVSIGTILVPLAKVDMAEIHSGRQDLMQILARCPHRRIPVYEKDRNNLLGYIEIDNVLVMENDFTDLKAFLLPLFRLNVSASILDAISILRKGNHCIAAVTADSPKAPTESKKILGILTLKDLVEELTGELTPH
jgi:CBS domain containing-hemolysin-like protein